MPDRNRPETLTVPTRGVEAWLARTHDRHDGTWIKPAKKSSGFPSITTETAVEVDRRGTAQRHARVTG